MPASTAEALASSSSGRWSCGRRAGGTSCWRRCGPSGPSSSARAGRADAVAERHAATSGRLGRAGRPAAARARPARAGRDRRRDPGAAQRARLAARPRTRSSSPAAWSPRCCDYGFLRLRPDVLAWAERVTERRPGRPQPVGFAGLGGRRVRGVDGGRRRRERRARAPARLDLAEQAGEAISPAVPRDRGPATSCSRDGSTKPRPGTDGPPTPPPTTRGSACCRAASRLLALAYAGEPGRGRAGRRAARRGRRPSPRRTPRTSGTAPARRTWRSIRRAGPPAATPRRCELAELTHASFVTGLAGASKASIDARVGDPARRRRGVPPADRPLAAGRDVVDAVDDAALDRRPAGPARPPSRRRRAGGGGAGDVGRPPHLRRRRGGARPSSAPGCAPRSATTPTRRRAEQARCSTATPPSSTRSGRCEARSDALTTSAARRGCRARPCRPARG